MASCFYKLFKYTILLNTHLYICIDTLCELMSVTVCYFSMLMALCRLKVVHRVTGEVMVVKQLLEFDREAQESFLKEVSAYQVYLGCIKTPQGHALKFCTVF